MKVCEVWKFVKFESLKVWKFESLKVWNFEIFKSYVKEKHAQV